MWEIHVKFKAARYFQIISQIDHEDFSQMLHQQYYRSPKWDHNGISDREIPSKFIRKRNPKSISKKKYKYFRVEKFVFQCVCMCISAEKYQHYRLINILCDFCRPSISEYSKYFPQYFRHLKFSKILTQEKY